MTDQERDTTTNSLEDRKERIDGFNPEVCALKYNGLNKRTDDLHQKLRDNHKIILDAIEEVRDDLKEHTDKEMENIKSKIILSEKIMGDKIDCLDRFDSSLRGNGSPGVWESIRNIKWSIGIIIFVLTILTIWQFGGSFRGVTRESIIDSFGSNPVEQRYYDSNSPHKDAEK